MRRPERTCCLLACLVLQRGGSTTTQIETAWWRLEKAVMVARAWIVTSEEECAGAHARFGPAQTYVGRRQKERRTGVCSLRCLLACSGLGADQGLPGTQSASSPLKSVT